MPRYRKKPVEIEAMQWVGDNYRAIRDFAQGEDGTVVFRDAVNNLFVRTLEGDMRAMPSDWIIRGLAGEFYPCKPDIFAATYEEV